MKNVHKILAEILKKGDLLGVLVVGRRVILNWISGRRVSIYGLDSTGAGYGPVVDFFFIKKKNFLLPKKAGNSLIS
jgi:hypothetical protein